MSYTREDIIQILSTEEEHNDPNVLFLQKRWKQSSQNLQAVEQRLKQAQTQATSLERQLLVLGGVLQEQIDQAKEILENLENS